MACYILDLTIIYCWQARGVLQSKNPDSVSALVGLPILAKRVPILTPEMPVGNMKQCVPTVGAQNRLCILKAQAKPVHWGSRERLSPQRAERGENRHVSSSLICCAKGAVPDPGGRYFRQGFLQPVLKNTAGTQEFWARVLRFKNFRLVMDSERQPLPVWSEVWIMVILYQLLFQLPPILRVCGISLRAGFRSYSFCNPGPGTSRVPRKWGLDVEWSVSRWALASEVMEGLSLR